LIAAVRNFAGGRADWEGMTANLRACLASAFAWAIAWRCSSESSPRGSTAAAPPPLTHRVDLRVPDAQRLLFAVVGDTRPPTVDGTASYPTDVIDELYADLEALVPRPQFVLSTGDYLFASEGSGQASAQLDLYLLARARYAGPLFPAMGNHECTGATDSNCGPGTVDGITEPYAAFLEKLLRPLGIDRPYYTVGAASAAGAWTAKVVVIAANAWSSEQAEWLEGVLSAVTTYTLVVRHEPAAATTAPGVAPSEAILARHPYTLSIVGHTHTYERSRGVPREVVIGNGGAPLSGKKAYGFGLVAQRDDGALEVNVLDWRTGERDEAFRFAVRPDGSPAP
jgi:hypothetical protein